MGQNVEPNGEEKFIVSSSGDTLKEIDSVTPPLTETKILRLGKASKPSKSITPADETSPSVDIWTDGRISKLIDAMARGKISEINPTIDVSTRSGYSYFEVDQLIESGADGSRPFLETLAKADVLNKKPFEKIHIDPDGSVLLMFVERCPHCDSGNIIKGQLVEHFSCGNLGLEQDYKVEHKYICPKCNKELKLLGTDYRNAGIRYRCLNCDEVFPTPIIKWRNLRSGKIWNYEDLQEVSLYSYELNPDKKDWLDFQLKPKAQLIDFLRLRGYHVEESARVNGTSGSEHIIDILATRDDGLAKYRCGIGILIASRNKGEVGLEELFEFDTKAYDTGLDYKVVIVVPKLSKEAIKFAERQKIGVFEATTPSDLIEFLGTQQQPVATSSGIAQSSLQDQASSIVEPKGQIAAFLERRGYQVNKNQRIIGRSGAEHIFDIIAYRDDVIVKPAIAVVVAIEEGGQVGIDKVAQFDAETFDAGIHNKIFVGIQRINEQAKRFATQQKIRILEEADLKDLIQSEKNL